RRSGPRFDDSYFVHVFFSLLVCVSSSPSTSYCTSSRIMLSQRLLALGGDFHFQPDTESVSWCSRQPSPFEFPQHLRAVHAALRAKLQKDSSMHRSPGVGAPRNLRKKPQRG